MCSVAGCRVASLVREIVFTSTLAAVVRKKIGLAGDCRCRCISPQAVEAEVRLRRVRAVEAAQSRLEFELQVPLT